MKTASFTGDVYFKVLLFEYLLYRPVVRTAPLSSSHSCEEKSDRFPEYLTSLVLI